jgi:hypothetical protein
MDVDEHYIRFCPYYHKDPSWYTFDINAYLREPSKIYRNVVNVYEHDNMIYYITFYKKNESNCCCCVPWNDDREFYVHMVILEINDNKIIGVCLPDQNNKRRWLEPSEIEKILDNRHHQNKIHVYITNHDLYTLPTPIHFREENEIIAKKIITQTQS